jgi:hypothetical protein
VNWAHGHGYRFSLFDQRWKFPAPAASALHLQISVPRVLLKNVSVTAALFWMKPRAVLYMLERRDRIGHPLCEFAFYLDGDAFVGQMSNLDTIIRQFMPRADSPSLLLACHSVGGAGAECPRCPCCRASSQCTTQQRSAKDPGDLINAGDSPLAMLESRCSLLSEGLYPLLRSTRGPCHYCRCASRAQFRPLPQAARVVGQCRPWRV